MYQDTLILTNKIFETIQEGKYSPGDRERVVADMESFDKIRLELLNFIKDRPHLSYSTKSDDCNDDIKRLIDERLEKGMKQYGHGLKQNSGYDWVQEALEESLDLAVYISAKLVEVKNMKRD
jgi:hypothetical protein